MVKTRAILSFSTRLLTWYENHGRKNLPWQQNPTPYRVWVSEIMLQQTQVGAVIGCYQRFIQRFPTIDALATADIDEVLHLWSGLGYYARARNLHRSAAVVLNEHAGKFPTDIDTVQSLPGIGRSTAAAILALAHGQHHTILDGNVKRVLCRHRGIDGWPGASGVARELWAHAESLTPRTSVAAYTQAMMDLGATLCTRAKPACHTCPVRSDCIARQECRQAELPAKKPRNKIPVRDTVFLIVRDRHANVLLHKRPPSGVWGGLWGFPECTANDDVAAYCHDRLGIQAERIQTLAPLRHTFSHFHLDIRPVVVDTGPAGDTQQIMDAGETLWYNTRQPQRIGLATPVSKLLADQALLIRASRQDTENQT